MIGLKDGQALLVPRGESLLVNVESQRAFAGRAGAWALDGRGEPLTIRTLQEPQAEVPEKVSIKYRPASGAVRQGNFTSFQDGRFRYELPPIVEPTSFTVTGGDDWFGPVRIEPIDRPAIDQLAIVARPPGSKQSETFAHTGADTPLLFLKDSELELQLTASAPLTSASLVAQPGPAPALERIDETHYEARWTMDRSQTFEIRLLGSQAGLESKPYFVSIGLLVDRPPRLTLRSSGVGKRSHAASEDSAAAASPGRFRPDLLGLGNGTDGSEREETRDQRPQDGHRVAGTGRRRKADRFRNPAGRLSGPVRPGRRHAGQAASDWR